MGSTIRSARVAPLILALALVLWPPEVQAQQFFGQDLHGMPNSRLVSWHNSTHAQSLFLGSLSGVGTESFESFANGTGGPLDLTFPGAGTATLAGPVSVVTQPGAANGRYPTDGNNYLSATFGAAQQNNFRIDFSDPVAAFGFMGTDIGDFGAQLTLTFLHSGGGTTAIDVPHALGTGIGSPADGSVLFFGFINALNPFHAVEFSASVGFEDDVFGFDQMTIGSVDQVIDPTVVPEPISMALLGTGLAGIAAVRRRRNPNSSEEV